jgi:hypothetical protein
VVLIRIIVTAVETSNLTKLIINRENMEGIGRGLVRSTIPTFP